MTREPGEAYKNLMEMNGKVVVVTGASMGIGEAVAKIFADNGASVVLLARDVGRADEARHRIGHTERTFALACDVRRPEAIDDAVAQTLERFGRLDVWVNNAGVGIRDWVADMDMAVCRDLFETNFFGAVTCLQKAVAAMRKSGGGTVINVSSVAGHIPVPAMGAYSATKFALNAIGKAARVELKRENIEVLTVCPGYVQTDFGTHLVTNKVGNIRPQSVKGISVERVARATYNAYRARKREVIVPWTMIPMVKLYQLLPGMVEWVMGRMMK